MMMTMDPYGRGVPEANREANTRFVERQSRTVAGQWTVNGLWRVISALNLVRKGGFELVDHIDK
jgi:hypothetical protein